MFVAGHVNILGLLKTSNMNLLFAARKCSTVCGMMSEQERFWESLKKKFEDDEDEEDDSEEISK